MATGPSLYTGTLPMPWHGQCCFYMSGQQCSPKTCTGAHKPKEERPPCRQFAEPVPACPHTADKCWLPHRVAVVAHPANVALQVAESHAGRLLEYLREVCGDHIAASASVRAHGLNRRDERVLLLELTPPAYVDELLERLKDDTVVAIALRRAYVVQHRAETLRDAVDAAVGALRALPGRRPGGAVTARLQTYPTGQLEPWTNALCDNLPPFDDGFTLRLAPKGYDAMVTAVLADGVHYVGVVPSGHAVTRYGHMSAKHLQDNDVCRAHYKLREVAARCGDVFGAAAAAAAASEAGGDGAPEGARRRRPRTAMDVGAAPGGWSSFLASPDGGGYDAVLAVDPGAMDPTLPPCVRHLPMRAAEAVTTLLDEGARGTVDCYVCDMNTPTATTVDIFESALPLLSPSSLVVLTLKNFDGPSRVWRANCDTAAARVAAACGIDRGSVRIVHLLANGSSEVTLLARFQPVAGVR
jgi:hypothetical protein